MDKNKFAQTPPMGWNSYDYYDTMVNEEQVKANADYMAAHLKPFGWEYVVVDIQWYAYGAGSMRDKHQYIPFSRLEMDEYGRLLPCPERFPSAADGAGFRPLADYIHSLGLKFGIHIMRGIPRAAAQEHLPVRGSSQTADEIANPFSICGWNPDMYGLRRETEGSQAYYDSLFELYAGWGVDYVKCDDICNTNLYKDNPYSAAHEIEMLHKAIEKCGRPVVLSLSPGPALIEKAWHYEKYANMWRITDDFWDKWELLLNMFERCELWQNHVKEGCFPDCDMLPLGYLGKGFGEERQTNFTRDEQVTMMTLWCIFRSPLMLGAEMTKLDDWTLSLLTNKKVLALLGEGHRGVQVERDDRHAVWAGLEEKEGTVYAALFNFREEACEISLSLEDLFAAVSVPAEAGVRVTAEELWTGEKGECTDGRIAGKVNPHGARLYRLSQIPRSRP